MIANNKTFKNNTIINGGLNCPDSSLENIVIKDNYFTIEKYNCNNEYYFKEYITFTNQDKLLLYKYNIEYTDRNNPDLNIPLKQFTSKNFGIKNFEQVTQEFLSELRNKE